MAQKTVFTFNFETYELKGLNWIIENPKAKVILLEGMEEHSSRYDYFAKELNKVGYSVYCLDYFGQGLNAGEDLSNLGKWPKEGFKKELEVINAFTLSLGKELPIYIFSHSMGSFFAQSFMQKYPGLVEKVVLCGPGAKNPAVPVGYFLAKLTTPEKSRYKKSHFINGLMFGSFNKKIKNPRTPYDWLSINTENVDTYIDDPLCGFGPNKGFCLDFISGMRGIHSSKNLKLLNPDTKIFIISGSEDPVSTYGASVQKLVDMYHKYGVKDVDGKLYQGYRHEILNEDIKDEVILDIVSFFNK